MAGVSTWGDRTASNWKRPCKRPSCGKDEAAGAGPSHCRDSAPAVGERKRWLNMATEVSAYGCHAGWSQPLAVRLQRRKTVTAKEQHQPGWCQPGHTRSLAPCSPHCRWPQSELSQPSGHKGKPAGKAGPFPTQKLFPRQACAPLLPTTFIHSIVDSTKILQKTAIISKERGFCYC